MKNISVEENLEKMLEVESKGYSWLIHRVMKEEDDGSVLANSHTHGMEQFGNDDFQIVLPFTDETIGMLLNGFGALVAVGNKIDEDTQIDGFFTTGPVKFVKVRETGRDVLRAICPDENGLYPEDEGCAPGYSDQMMAIFED